MAAYRMISLVGSKGKCKQGASSRMGGLDAVATLASRLNYLTYSTGIKSSNAFAKPPTNKKKGCGDLAIDRSITKVKFLLRIASPYVTSVCYSYRARGPGNN